MRLNGKKTVLMILLSAAAGLLAGSILKFTPVSTVFNPTEFTVILDAGHGEPDGGATGAAGTVEKDINLAITKKLREVFEGKGIRVIMTRETDSGIQDGGSTIREMKRSDMNKRLDIMKKSRADLFLSIHMNYFPSKEASGLRVFYDKNHEETEELAKQIQDKIGEVTGAKTYAVKTADQSLFLMKNPPLPSVLVECGFLSNPEEEKKLNDEEYQAKIAWGIAYAVENYYNLNK